MKRDIPPHLSLPYVSSFLLLHISLETGQRNSVFMPFEKVLFPANPPPPLDKCPSIRQYIERKGELQQDKLSFEGISNGEKQLCKNSVMPMQNTCL